MTIGLSPVAVGLPAGVEPVDDILVRSGCGRLERRMFTRVHGLRDSPTLADGERLEDLLVRAGRAALDGGPADLVLYGHTLLIAELDLDPGFRDRIRAALGLTGVPLHGVSHVNCTSVLRAVELAGRYLTRPGARAGERVLVLGGEQGSASDKGRFIPGTTVAGDAVVAVVVHAPDATAGVRYRRLGTATGRDVRFHRNLRLPPEDFALFGKVCCTETVRTLSRAAADAGLGLDDLDLVLPHLSNRMFWRSVSAESGIPWDRIHLDLMGPRGHNFGTDALMSLEHADRTGRLRPGDRCALVSVGQGAYFQATIVEVVADR